MLTRFRGLFLVPPDDPPNDPTGGNPGGGEPSAPRKVRCEFCECVIAPQSGDVVRMSDKARAFRDSESKIAALTAENERLKREAQERLNAEPPNPNPAYTGPERRSGQKLFFGKNKRARTAA